MSLITIVTAIPDFQGIAFIIFFSYLKNNVFKNRLGIISELMQVITDNCNLIDLPTLRRSFKNMKGRE
jgi:hypothetical protein